MSKATNNQMTPLNIAVLTVSDTRDLNNDTSGDYLVKALQKDGHNLGDRQLVKDDKYQLRAIVSQWIANQSIHAIITTGGTGFTPRDNTPEALAPLFDKTIDGNYSAIYLSIQLALQLFNLAVLQALQTTLSLLVCLDQLGLAKTRGKAFYMSN